MNLIEAFDKNLIINKTPDKIIETIISRLYFYGDSVYKVYKYGKFFFGDFGSPDFRKNFYKEDFYWNNIMAPDIYLNLKGTAAVNDEHKITELSVAEDFFIEMKKFDDNKNLTNLLLQKQISENDIKKIISEMVTRIKEITENKKSDPTYNFNQKLIDINLADLESDANLLHLIPSFISAEKTDKIFNFLENISKDNPYFKNYDSNNLSALIDNHADNVIFLDERVEFIDVLPPKKSWRIGDIHFIVSRIATDMAVLWEKEKADMLYSIYQKDNKPIPIEITSIYEIRSALIQMWCFYSQDKLDIAQKYLNFVEEKISFLKK
ncbi:MAG: hypothetical protein Q8O66_01875 [bacterium]|nr:hypothetical protein [bacterium]